MCKESQWLNKSEWISDGQIISWRSFFSKNTFCAKLLYKWFSQKNIQPFLHQNSIVRRQRWFWFQLSLYAMLKIIHNRVICFVSFGSFVIFLFVSLYLFLPPYVWLNDSLLRVLRYNSNMCYMYIWYMCNVHAAIISDFYLFI